jgi:hypothetical protein
VATRADLVTRGARGAGVAELVEMLLAGALPARGARASGPI